MVRKILMVLFVILALIQFIRIDKTPHEIDITMDFTSSMVNTDPEVLQLIRNACYDCHSYETKYPWYTNIAPVSWWINGHIDHGREELNFSEWHTYEPKRQSHKMEECVEHVKKEKMPLTSYTWIHPEARLSDAQREKLVWFFDSLR